MCGLSYIADKVELQWSHLLLKLIYGVEVFSAVFPSSSNVMEANIDQKLQLGKDMLAEYFPQKILL